MRRAGVPILTWHSMHVEGPDYARNDHVAFARDLETLHELGLRIVPLERIVDALLHDRLERLSGCVGLTFDDGPDFDYHDVPHPAWGPQRGMLRILEDFRARHGADAQPQLHATSFVIVSPDARAALDRTCMVGCRWWNEDWWRAAESSALMAVESHSWDHNHESLERTASTSPRGGFALRDEREAQIEVGEAARYLRAARGRDGPVLFAYPYGEADAFLATDWLPRRAGEFGIAAAFATGDGVVTRRSPRWNIPRFVFRHDWKAQGDLKALLRDVGVVPRTTSPFLSRLMGGDRRAKQEARPQPRETHRSWRDHLKTWEVNDARAVAGDLFQRRFGHAIPGYPRHFVLVHSPPADAADTAPSVVAYVHQMRFDDDVYLCGGMCVDEGAYRRMPRWLFRQVREEGGLATIVTRESVEMLGDAAAIFGHVGEPRARAADLRTGFVDTDREHLMAIWRRPLSDEEKARYVERIAAFGAF